MSTLRKHIAAHLPDLMRLTPEELDGFLDRKAVQFLGKLDDVGAGSLLSLDERDAVRLAARDVVRLAMEETVLHLTTPH